MVWWPVLYLGAAAPLHPAPTCVAERRTVVIDCIALGWWPPPGCSQAVAAVAA